MKKENDINFEGNLWKSVDKLRKKVNVHEYEYKYAVLSLIFLRYMSYAFEERKKELEKKLADSVSGNFIPYENMRQEALEDKDRYLSHGILYAPDMARWDYLVKNANQPNISEIIDKVIELIEKEYPSQSKDVIPKKYTSINLDPFALAFLTNTFTSIEFGYDHKRKDIFGRIYEYFLGKFAKSEGKKGGEFYTLRSLTDLIVSVFDANSGRIFEPACRSDGFFISTHKKLEAEDIDKNRLTIYSQESKQMTWKLCNMNLTSRGVDDNIGLSDSYQDDKFFDLMADFVVSNPPFNDSDFGGDRINYDDSRFKYGIPIEDDLVWGVLPYQSFFTMYLCFFLYGF